MKQLDPEIPSLRIARIGNDVWKNLVDRFDLPNEARSAVQHALDTYAVEFSLASGIQRAQYLRRATRISIQIARLMKNIEWLSREAFPLFARAYTEVSDVRGDDARGFSWKEKIDPSRMYSEAGTLFRTLKTELAKLDRRLTKDDRPLSDLVRSRPGLKDAALTALVNMLNVILEYWTKPPLDGSKKNKSNEFAFEVCKLADPKIRWTTVKNAIRDKVRKNDYQEYVHALRECLVYNKKYRGTPIYYAKRDAIVLVVRDDESNTHGSCV